MDTTKQQYQRIQRHTSRLERRLEQLHQYSDRFVKLRVGTIGLGLVISFLLFSQVSIPAGYTSLLIMAVLFAAEAWRHRKVQHSIQRHRWWRYLKQQQLARITLDWEALPVSKATAPAEHPFAYDVDIVGQYSLHRLLDTTTSREGSNRLLEWLLASAPPAETINTRQALIAELRRLTNFRDRLTLHGWLAAGAPDRRLNGDRIRQWLLEQEQPGPTRWDLLILTVLAALNLILPLTETAGLTPRWWPFTFMAYVAISLVRLRPLGDLFGTAMSLKAMLINLHGIFRYIEKYDPTTSPALSHLCQPFHDSTQRPSHQLRRLSWIISATSLRGNMVLWALINAIIPWDMWSAWLLTRQQRTLAAHLPTWLETWYTLEALSALATFGYLNPDYTLPTLDTEHSFHGVALGHPLIPHTERITNDFSLARAGEVVLITGSNMAGKSSFLRTLGLNLALAYAGGPVPAQHLRIGQFRLFSTIRINDSITEGFSYFYAEVRRLRQLLDALNVVDAPPLFFLIDEIFKGTNNRERLIGSRAYIRALAGHNGMGVVSTHDLDLVQLADEIQQIQNMHFREDVVDGRMTFDYLLHPGPCPTTNALKIMALEGLPVEET